jgi:Flp pilus assembly protein TadD
MTATRNSAIFHHAALGVALLLGTTPNLALAQTREAQTPIQAELRHGNSAKAVELAEAAVAKAPQDGSRRAELGQAYLRAGRFESAMAALSDAVALGDTADHVILSLALAQIACGQNRAALATLDQASRLAPADLGLALALAGDPGHGIAVLTDAVRDGAASAKLRQNLAYAEALDGRWADATLTAGFDLPPDQVEARLQQWAQAMQSGNDRARIARLLNVPLTADQGMPENLALNGAKSGPAVAMANDHTP